MPEILILGDTNPGPASKRTLLDGRPILSKSIQNELDTADVVLANLEAPVSDSESKTQKSGPSLSIPVNVFDKLHACGISCFGLANNHMMDLGTTGLRDTLAQLDEREIQHTGAGENLQIAGQPLIMTVGQYKLGILAASAHEFGLAGRRQPGVLPMDPVELLPRIRELRPQVDRLIVLIHAGNELFPYPNPWLQAYCRLLAEFGANLISCQHSHIVGCMERHEDSVIVYGQGNFLLDLASPTPDCYREGLSIRYSWQDGQSEGVELKPHIQDRTHGIVEEMQQDAAGTFMDSFHNRSNEILDPELLEKRWDEYCKSMARNYRSQLTSGNQLLAGLLRRFAPDMLLKSKKRDLLTQNLIRSQDHREAILRILEGDL